MVLCGCVRVEESKYVKEGKWTDCRSRRSRARGTVVSSFLRAPLALPFVGRCRAPHPLHPLRCPRCHSVHHPQPPHAGRQPPPLPGARAAGRARERAGSAHSRTVDSEQRERTAMRRTEMWQSMNSCLCMLPQRARACGGESTLDRNIASHQGGSKGRHPISVLAASHPAWPCHYRLHDLLGPSAA